MTIGWFIMFVLLLIIELVTVNLVTIWFSIGALAAMISTFFTVSIWIQLLVFIVVSIIMLIITKPLIKKFKGVNFVPTNSDMVIGKVGDVVKQIDKNNYGEVKVYGNTWTAYSEDEIPVGSKVVVLGIEGVKLIVKKKEEI